MNTEHVDLNKFIKTLLSVLLLSVLLHYGKLFLVPIAIAAFVAMLLFPLVQKLQLYNIRKNIAALISILVLLIVLTTLSSLVYYQIIILESDIPRLEEQIGEKTKRFQWLLYETTDLTQYEQDELIEEQKPNIAKAVFKSVRDFVLQGLYTLLLIFIVLTYTFFLMIYHERIQTFFTRLQIFDSKKEAKLIFAKISSIIHSYLKGTLTVISILAVIYALGLWAIGIEHAILFALITALLRIIPYFGSYVGIALPVAFALLLKDSLWYPVLVLVFFMATQLLEANLLTPYITGSRVKLNPLATIMVILLGGLIWGIPGMVLFVPIFASLKVVFDRIPRLQPYGFILGKEEDTEIS